jgi:hypothetical protein
MTVSPVAPEGANGGAALAPLHSHTVAIGVNTRRIAAGSLTAEALPASDTSPLDAARLYIAAGLAVVSCCALAPGDPPQCTAERGGGKGHKGHGTPDKHGKVRAGKAPVPAWEGRASTSPAEAAAWWGRRDPWGPNVALLMGPGGLLAIDVDGPAGEASLAAAVDVLGPLPPTLENVTGRADGGRHLLFAVPADASAGDVEALTKSVAGMRLDGGRFVAGGESSGLDLRAGDLDAARSIIVVAPSVHASGARYQWRGGPVAELPRRWWDALPRSSSGPKPPTGAALPLEVRPGVVATHATERPSGALVEVLPPTGQRQREPRSVDPVVRSRAAFEAAFPTLCAEVRDAPDGVQNTTLNNNTVRACRMALAAGVDLDTVCAGMVAAGLDGNHPEGATRATVASARAAAEQLGPATLRERPPRASTRASSRASTATTSADAGMADDVEGDDGPEGHTGLPVVLTGPDVARVADDAVRALARHPDAYQRTGVGLVRLIEAVEPESATEQQRQRLPPAGSLVIEAAPPPTVTEWLSTVCEFRARDARVKRGDGTRWIQPPGPVVAVVCARKVYPRDLRPLVGIIEAPALRRDGSCITAPGYDARSGLYLRWHGAPVEVPEHPTRDDARAAYDTLAGLFEDFTFQGDADARRVILAATVAAILTPLARTAIVGPVPAFMWSADAQLAGKSLMASTCGAVVLGRAPSARQYTPDDDEMAKRIAAVAMSGAPLWMIDNIRAHIEGGALELALTAHDTIAARILGATVDREMPWRPTTYLTGNGASYSADIARRLLHIALLSRGRVEGGSTHGTTERTFRHVDLMGHVLEHRPELLRAALVILRAHLAAGRPSSGDVLPSFEAWSRVVAHAVWWASGVDPVRARPPESANRDTDVARRIALAWHGAAPGEALTLSAMCERIKGADISRGGTEPGRVAALVELGSALAEFAGAAELGRVKAGSLGRRVEQHLLDRAFPHPNGGRVRIVAAGLLHGSKRYVSRVEAPVTAPVDHTPDAGHGWGSGGSGGSVESHQTLYCIEESPSTAEGLDGGRVTFDA